jgi:nucleoside-diphosphate kinase
MTTENIERSLVLIKPDALKNSLTGYILSQFSEFHTGLRFAGLKVVGVNLELAEEHYAEHFGKFFYPSLLDYIRGYLHYPDNPERRRVIAIVYQGENAIKKIRDICGPTNPHDARVQKPGCIRALGTVVPLKDETGTYIGDRVDNLIHASANPADAEREVKLWFCPTDIPPVMRGHATDIADTYYYYNPKTQAVGTAAEPGALCFVGPGAVLWSSDLAVLKQVQEGKTPDYPVKGVVAKYLINREGEGS